MLYPIRNNVRNRLDLSGIRDFKIGPDEVGNRGGWFNGLANARPMAVPGSWNEQYEDISNYLGLAWYSRRTHIPRRLFGWRQPEPLATDRSAIDIGSCSARGRLYDGRGGSASGR